MINCYTNDDVLAYKTCILTIAFTTSVLPTFLAPNDICLETVSMLNEKTLIL